MIWVTNRSVRVSLDQGQTTNHDDDLWIFFRRGGWRLCQPEPQRLRWFAVHYFDNVFIDDLFCNHHYKDIVFFVIWNNSFPLDWFIQGEHTHFWREREDGQFDSEAGKTWPGWFVKKFQSKIDFVDLANIWKKTFQADIIMGIHLRKRLSFLSKQAQCFQIPGTDRLFFMK